MDYSENDKMTSEWVRDGVIVDSDGKPIILTPGIFEYEGKLEFSPIEKGTVTLIGINVKDDDFGRLLMGDTRHIRTSTVCYDCGKITLRLSANHPYTGELRADYKYVPKGRDSKALLKTDLEHSQSYENPTDEEKSEE